MLFSDPKFLFVFLPAAWTIFHLLRTARGGREAIWLLIAASCVFYGWWSIYFLSLILAQIVINFFFARHLHKRQSRTVLWTGIAFNLILIGYFKYKNFFIGNLGDVIGLDWSRHLSALIIPLGISFHTFQQIALLVDVADEEADAPSLKHYLMFVLFFPQMIAGPIVLHREMAHQIVDTEKGGNQGLAWTGPGLVLLIFGLFKKVVIADSLAPVVDATFSWPGMHLQFAEAWFGIVAYALQLYFDFSGYSDMAVGLAAMFGFRLPFNFNVPFRSTSMIEYWKRWHITMTRFFTMYVYVPTSLGLTRTAMAGRYRHWPMFAMATVVPTLAAFLASGLWHGAGWTFIVFGLVNAIGLIVNHLWRELKILRLWSGVAWLFTAVTILVTLVYFRSASLEQAHYFLGRMFLPSQIVLPDWAWKIGQRLNVPVMPYEVFTRGSFTVRQMLLVLIAAPLSVLLPNPVIKPLEIKPSFKIAFACAAMLWLTMGLINEPRTFLYFQF